MLDKIQRQVQIQHQRFNINGGIFKFSKTITTGTKLPIKANEINKR